MAKLHFGGFYRALREYVSASLLTQLGVTTVALLLICHKFPEGYHHTAIPPHLHSLVRPDLDSNRVLQLNPCLLPDVTSPGSASLYCVSHTQTGRV